MNTTPDTLFHIEDAQKYVGKEIAVTNWITLTQDQVTQFATSTKDPDWMHVDVARSQLESHYRTTIVQGFLMLFLVIHFAHEVGLIPAGTEFKLNYDLDRVRFTDVVTMGSKVRSRITLLDVTPKDHGCSLHKTQHYLEVEGKDKPAMVAEYLVLWFAKLEHDKTA